MKWRLMFFFAIGIFMNPACSNHKAFEITWNGLSKSYVINKSNYANKSDFLEEFKVDYLIYKKDSAEYFNSLQLFLSSNPIIISDLLKFENSKEICNWIKTRPPSSSLIKENDLMNKSDAAKILLDNYILEPDSIVIQPYINEISYAWLKFWYNPQETKRTLKLKYMQHIKNLSN